MLKPKTVPNDPAKKGQLASYELPFRNGRYKVAAVHTRFDDIFWFVWDYELQDGDGFPSAIRIESSFEDAVKGL